MATPTDVDTPGISALTGEPERWSDGREWFGRLLSAVDRLGDVDQSAVRDLDYDLWEFFQAKFSNGEANFAADVLKQLHPNDLPNTAHAHILRDAIVRNTAVFQYDPEIGAARKQLLA